MVASRLPRMRHAFSASAASNTLLRRHSSGLRRPSFGRATFLCSWGVNTRSSERIGFDADRQMVEIWDIPDIGRMDAAAIVAEVRAHV
jgi:hypothetical protein